MNKLAFWNDSETIKSMNDKLIKLKNDLFEPKKFFTKKNNQFHYADLYQKYLD